MDLTNVYIGFALATFAGLSTGIGSLLGLYSKFENKRLLSLALGFSATTNSNTFSIVDFAINFFKYS